MDNVEGILNGYRYALRNARKCFRELNDARLAAVRSPSYMGAPLTPGIGSSSVEKQVEIIDDLERKAAKARGKAADLAEKILDMIDALDEYEEKTILHMRYLNGCSYESIARELDLSRGYVLQLRQNAVRKLNDGRAG